MPMAKPPSAAKPIAFLGQDFNGEEKNGTMNKERTATTNTIITMNGMGPNSALLYPARVSLPPKHAQASKDQKTVFELSLKLLKLAPPRRKIAAAAKIDPTQIKPGTSSGFKINEKIATKITLTPIRGD